MHSEFLNKFKGKTNKVPKEGVINLIEAMHKKPPKLIHSKPTEGKYASCEKQTKTKRKKQKNSLSNKQNKRLHHVSQSANELKRTKQKSSIKVRQILSVKQHKKPLEININVKKQPLKLPKISKENPPHPVQSVRNNSKSIPKQHITQQNKKSNPHERAAEKQKRSLLSDVRDIKPQKPHPAYHGIQSLLDQEALTQLKKLNDFEMIVQEMSIRKQHEMEEEELMQKSRHFRKGVTVHY